MAEKFVATTHLSSGSQDDEAAFLPGVEIKNNVLSQFSEEDVRQMGHNYAEENGLDPILFSKAAAVARSPTLFQLMSFLSDEEKAALNHEHTHKWDVPKRLFAVIAMGSMAAAVQGMDQTVINGANLFWPKRFGVTTMENGEYIEGLVNGSPYLCCGVIACWMSHFCNQKLGRKYTIGDMFCVWNHLYLAGSRQQLVALIYCAFFLGLWCRYQVRNSPGIRCRVCAASYSGLARYVVAVFHCSGDHVRLCGIACILLYW